MNNLTKSVKLIGEVVYLMLGADFTRPIDTELIKNPHINYICY